MTTTNSNKTDVTLLPNNDPSAAGTVNPRNPATAAAATAATSAGVTPTMEEIFHTRLLTREYFGGRANPRGTLSKCSILFRDWLCSNPNLEQKLLQELRFHNLEVRKMALMERSMEADLQEYDRLQQQLDIDRATIRQEIQNLQQALASERLIRQDKLEYEACKLSKYRKKFDFFTIDHALIHLYLFSFCSLNTRSS